jgi:hypothetical protein
MTAADGIAASTEELTDEADPIAPTTTGDGVAASTEEQTDEAGRALPDHVMRDSDTRAIPVVGPPLALEPLADPEKKPRADLFDTVVLPVVAPRPLPALIVRREPQRPVGAGTARDAKRPAAPAAIRVTVGVLFLLLLASSGALVTLQERPSAFDSLRQNYVIPSPSQPTTTNTSVPTSATHPSLVSTTSSAVTYSVPTSSYSIVITIRHPCWLVVHSPATSSATLLAKTIEPGLSPLTVPVHGSASITIAARAASLSIVSGTTTLDTVENPRLGVAYTFVPVNS